MDEYADIYYVDARNAVTDHRHSSGGGRPGGFVPSRTVVVAPPGARMPTYGGPARVPYAHPVAPAVYPPYAQPTAFSSLFQRLTTGQIVEMVAQAFAAMQPLPAAPVATTRVSDDIENLVSYQGALASYAKRDEQIRTIGSIIAKLA